MILDPLPTTFNAKGSDSRADVTFSGKLESADKKFFLSGATITLKFTGFTVDKKNYYEVITDNEGKFNEVFTLLPATNYGIQAVFDGVESKSGNIWTSSKSQIEYFIVTSSSQPTSSVGGPTFLKLEIETDKRDVTVKGKLTEKGKNSPARNVQITLIPTGFAFNSITTANMGYCKISELPNCELTTDNFGNFKVKLTLPQSSIGKKYSIQAISAANNQWESSKSLTQSFTITSSSQPSTQSSGDSDSNYLLILLILGVVCAVAAVVIINKNKKKTPRATPQRKTFGVKPPRKRRTAGSPVGASSSADGPSTYGYFECPNCHEPSAPQGKLGQNPDGSQFCSKCGWDSED